MAKGDEGQFRVLLDKDAMTCDEPKRILQLAASLYKVEQMLMEKVPDDRDEAVGLAMTTCLLQAFTSELMLKCLIRIEGGSPPQTHDLLHLFNLLHASTRQQLEARWRAYVQSQPETTEAVKQLGVTIEPELTSALAAGRRAFEFIRYWHEDAAEEYLPSLGRVLIKSRSTIWIINVRFGSLCGLKSDISRGPRSASPEFSHSQCHEPTYGVLKKYYSINSSGSRSGGGVSPSCLAVFALMTS